MQVKSLRQGAQTNETYEVSTVVSSNPEGASEEGIQRLSTAEGERWLKGSKCINKRLWGQFEFLANRRVIISALCQRAH